MLIDWNLGNFSVDYHGDRFRLYSRWDYDWFRMDPRTLDFYFLSRVSSRTGDRTVFTYGPHTFVEPRFQLFLNAYHRVYPLRPNEVVFLREVYRFFILNYVDPPGLRVLPARPGRAAAEGGGHVLPAGRRPRSTSARSSPSSTDALAQTGSRSFSASMRPRSCAKP